MLIAVPLDHSHSTVEALEDLLPEAFVAGGSFAAELQHPTQIPQRDRKSVFEIAQKHAIGECIQELCGRAGLPRSTRVENGPGGQRLWPNGYVGSLTHKGTVVIGAMALGAVYLALGIDLEFIDSSKLEPITKDIARDGLPPDTEPSIGVLITLSAKEAVFKAQYPLTSKLLSFSDVALVWTSQGRGNFSATVECSEISGLEIRCVHTGTWIVSVANIPTKP